MKIRQLMHGPAESVRPETFASVAYDMMRVQRCHHMPVTRPDGQVIGIISVRDIRDYLTAFGSPRRARSVYPVLERVRVRKIMTPNPVTIGPEEEACLALDRMRHFKIRSLPVVEKGRLRGIVTDTDVRRVIKRLLRDLGQRAKRRKSGRRPNES